MDSSVRSTGDLSTKEKKKKKKGSASKSPTRKASNGEKAGTIKRTRSFEKTKPPLRRSSSWDGKMLPPTHKGSASSSPHNGGKGIQNGNTQPKQPQQPLFKLPRRTKTPPPAVKGPQGKAPNTTKPMRRMPSAPPKLSSADSSIDDQDLESVESELGSVEVNNDAAPNSQPSIHRKPAEIHVVQEGETSEESLDDSFENGTAGARKNGVKRSKEQMKQIASAEKAQKQRSESSSEESDLDEDEVAA
jgi:hypothetical protein